MAMDDEKHSESTTNTPEHTKTQVKLANKPIKRSWYSRMRGKLMQTAVEPKLIGELPENILHVDNQTITDDNPLIFYVLQEHSRSNSILIDNETRRLGMPPALEKVRTEYLNEKASIIFIKHGQTRKTHAHSPRLFRVLEAAQKHNFDVLLVPVTILWGRDPGKEDSVFKLLAADSWGRTTLTKQLINIGINGRDTYVQFHPSMSLKSLLDESQIQTPGIAPINAIESKISSYLDGQREMVIGPDLSDRRNEVDKILYSPAVKHAIMTEADESNRLPQTVRNEARGYMQEIVSDYSSTTVRAFERGLDWLWTQLYDGVKVTNFEQVRELAENYELIYLPCHRSHIDYMLIMYVLYKRGLRTPFVAAGDNLNIPLVGPILRRGGAFFLRRSFGGNALYTSVFREYMHNMISRNIPLKFFLEGGRSRSGRLLPPKVGLLAMTVQSRLRGAGQGDAGQTGKPIVYVPAYIGYERLMEGTSYVDEMLGKPKESESVWQLIRAMRKIERIFGHVHLNFGEPIFLDDILTEKDVNTNLYDTNRNDQSLADDAKEAIRALSIKVSQHINNAAVINPISLLSLVLLSTPKHALSETNCVAQLDLYRTIARQAQYDKQTVLTNMSGEDIINYGLKLKLIKRVRHVMGDMIAIAEGQSVFLTYFRNNILHTFIMPSMIAALAHHNGRMQRDDILSLINLMYPFLQAELFLKWKRSEVESIIEHIIEVMIDTGLLQDDGRGMLYAQSPNSSTNHQLSVLATPVQESLKRYFMTLSLISGQGSGKMTSGQIVDLCHLLGQRMSVLYEFDSPEFFDRSLFKSFIAALLRTRYLRENDEGHLVFDTNIDNVAENARFVLDAETLDILTELAELSEDEIATAVAELENKKQRRFARRAK